MRYLPLTESDRAEMLAAIGVDGMDTLFSDIPESAKLAGLLDLPMHSGEIEVERALEALAAKNLTDGDAPSFLGAGAYHHHVPAAVDALIQRGEFLTAYTPYQPEISQGTLQSLFEFQTQVAMITGLDVANASMYDGATACAEAVYMASRITRRHRVVLSGALHPQYREVVATATRFLPQEIIAAPAVPGQEEDLAAMLDDNCACVVVQYPDIFGELRDFTALAESCHEAGALLIVAVTEVVALGLVRSPGEMGADIVVAEGKSLGNALNFGGPYLGLFACRDRHVRQMPGRLIGETTDVDGNRGWVLTLATREQHIRREKATSNICTNSGLCALAFSIHLSLLGEDGFTRLARINHARAVTLADRLAELDGVELINQAFFNEFTLRLTRPAGKLVDELAAAGILAGVPVSRLCPDDDALADLLLVAVTESATDDDMAALVDALAGAL